ncbi:Protein ssh4 [Tieghemiomyces parasiticus]|uniref:Protein ssh4 n=1 Tax=Tieghemiomyces parasiticus TaxID=78921 RepID=A0A9W8A5A2_9FUNG|nr:Protein ssh4 [Tieghemiomyces parasiticus]
MVLPCPPGAAVCAAGIHLRTSHTHHTIPAASATIATPTKTTSKAEAISHRRLVIAGAFCGLAAFIVTCVTIRLLLAYRQRHAQRRSRRDSEDQGRGRLLVPRLPIYETASGPLSSIHPSMMQLHPHDLASPTGLPRLGGLGPRPLRSPYLGVYPSHRMGLTLTGQTRSSPKPTTPTTPSRSVIKNVLEEPVQFADDEARLQHDQARLFESLYPYNSVPTRITQDQRVYIEEYGVKAWEFMPPVHPAAVGLELAPTGLADRVRIQTRTEIEFLTPSTTTAAKAPGRHQECLVHTNLPLPSDAPVYYFEVKLMTKPADTNVAIGLVTKPYPSWRLCGWNAHSVGFHTDSGSLFQNSAFKSVLCGERCYTGDVIGCGYQPQQGTVFFTRNGYRLPTYLTNVCRTFFPAVSANGPCQLSVNFGQAGFVFIEANVKKWGLGPLEGTLLPPPKYADALNSTTLLASAGEVERSPGCGTAGGYGRRVSTSTESDADTLVSGQSSRRSSMNTQDEEEYGSRGDSHQARPELTRATATTTALGPVDWHFHPHDLTSPSPSAALTSRLLPGTVTADLAHALARMPSPIRPLVSLSPAPILSATTAAPVAAPAIATAALPEELDIGEPEPRRVFGRPN